MNSPLNKIISITEESLSALVYAHQALKSAEAAFKALTASVSEHSDAFHMARMGELFCMDQAGGIDCMHENYDRQFVEVLCAGQNGDVHS
jgi:hypothetical protein